MDHYKSYDELPLTLSAEELHRFLGISKCSCYNMFKRKDFPTIRVVKRLLVSRDRFLEWLEKHTQEVGHE